jgi:hypothetical protein
MPGQPTPPLLAEAFALAAPNSSPASPTPGGKTVPFPTASQIGIVNGAASLNDGFPPLTMTPPSAGGIPPYGVDMNGILYILSAHVAAIAAGQPYHWSSTLETDMGGYALGAVLQQLADPTAFWINLVSGNATNPDTASPLGSTGWMSTKPLDLAVSLTGAQNDYALPGASDYLLDVTATGAVNFTGIVAQRDGQRVTIRKVDASANAVTLASLSGSSAAAHQFQIIAAGLSLPQQYMALTVMWNATVNKWVQV